MRVHSQIMFIFGGKVPSNYVYFLCAGIEEVLILNIEISEQLLYKNSCEHMSGRSSYIFQILHRSYFNEEILINTSKTLDSIFEVELQMRSTESGGKNFVFLHRKRGE